jgi:hypothetical protein
MSEQRTTWLRFSVTIIASMYAILGAAGASQYVYAVLITGTRQSGPVLLDGLVPLFIAFGLFTLRPWARILSLVISGFLIFTGVVGLLLCLAHVFGFVTANGGSIVDRPGLTIGALILVIVFACWQWWILSRPSIRAMFCSSPNQP